MLVIGRGQTISTAAHEADFADAAHLTRTFYQMVSLAPSLLMRGEFFEIRPPFETSGSPSPCLSQVYSRNLAFPRGWRPMTAGCKKTPLCRPAI